MPLSHTVATMNRPGLGVGLVCCLLLATAGVVAGSPAESPGGVGLDQGQEGQVTITDVSLNRTTVAVGETVTVEGIVEAVGDETTTAELSLEIDGRSVETRTAEAVQPGFPVIARFEWTPEEAGTYTVAIDGVEAGSELVVEDGAGEGTSGSENGGSGDEAADAGQFAVRNVSLQNAEITVGETTTVIADIGNDGDQPGDYEVTLEIDGEPVRTETVEQIQPNIDVGAQQFFDFEPEESGTYTVSVNGVEAGQQLVVDSSGGGGLFGFLPLGIIRPVVLFVGLPILLIYLALKGLALYLGY